MPAMCASTVDGGVVTASVRRCRCADVRAGNITVSTTAGENECTIGVRCKRRRCLESAGVGMESGVESDWACLSEWRVGRLHPDIRTDGASSRSRAVSEAVMPRQARTSTCDSVRGCPFVDLLAVPEV